MWVNVVALAVTLGLGAWAIGFTLAPLFGRKGSARGLMPVESAEVREEEDAVLANLAELDLDYGLGRIPEAEYVRAQEGLHRRALVLLAEGQKQELVLDALIEEAVASRRQRPRVAVSAGTCPQCRQPVEEAARFCSRCGAQLSGPAPAAPAVRPPVAASPPARRSSAPAARAGASEPPRQQEAPRVIGGNTRGVRWLVAGAGAGVVFLAAVAWLYFSSPIFKPQVPLSTVPARDYQAMLVSPANANLVLLSYDNGLLASADGGRDWRPMDVTGNIRALAASPSRPPVLYAAGPNLLSRSEDGGVTWQTMPLTLPTTDIRAFTVTGGASETLYAVAGATGLYASRDQGQMWESVSNQVPTGAVALVSTTGQMETFFLATRFQGVLTGDGRSWGSANGSVNSVLPTMDITALAFDAKSGDRSVMPGGGAVMVGALYAGAESGLFKSVDGGGSWKRLPFNAGVQALALSPNNSDTIYVVDRQGRVFRSLDRGLTWTNSP